MAVHRGKLSETGCCGLVRAALAGRFSGRLELSGEGVRRSLLLRRGAIVSGASTAAEETLVGWLLQIGAITRAVADSLGDELGGEPLHAQLAAAGVANDDLVQHGLDHGCALARRVFDVWEGEYRLDPLTGNGTETGNGTDDGSGRGAATVRRTPTAEIVLSGLREVRHHRALFRAVGSLDQCYRLAGPLDRLGSELVLSTAEWAILARLQSPVSVRELCLDSRLEDLRIHQLLMGFWALELVERLPPLHPNQAALEAVVADLSGLAGAPAEDGPPPLAAASESGRLGSGGLPDLLRSLYEHRRTGALSLRRADAEVEVRFSRGSVNSVRASAPEHRLGDIVCRLGLATPQQVAAIDTTTAREPIGPALVRARVLTEEQLRVAVDAQIRAVLLPVFNWTEGQWSFTPSAVATAEPGLPQLSTAQILLEGIRGLSDVDGVAEFLSQLGRRLRVSREPHAMFQVLDLRPDEGFLLSRIDGIVETRDLLQLSPQSEEATARTLYALLCTGLIEVAGDADPDAGSPGATFLGSEPHPATAPQARPSATSHEVEELHSRLGGLDHFGVLGLHRGASAEQIEAAFRRIALRFHPDRGRTPADKERLEAIFLRVVEAMGVLRDPSRRRGYEELLDAPAPSREPGARPVATPSATSARQPTEPKEPGLTADQHYQRARGLLRRAQYWDAITSLRQAVELAPQDGSYRLALARAIGRNPNWKQEAEREFLAVIDLEPWRADAHSLLGDLYRRGGLERRAQAMFQRALELDPNDRVARKAVGAGPGADAKRSLGDMFRRLVGSATEPGTTGED